MRRLVYLAALAAAAPDTDTQLKRAAALARWVDRTGPAPPSWTVAGPKDVTGGDRAFLLALIRHASAEDPDDRPSFAELVGAIDRRVDGVTVN